MIRDSAGIVTIRSALVNLVHTKVASPIEVRLAICILALSFLSPNSAKAQSRINSPAASQQRTAQEPSAERAGTRTPSDAARVADRSKRKLANALLAAKARYRETAVPSPYGLVPGNTIIPYTPRDLRTRATGVTSHAVSETGAAILEVPLWVPPGRAGVQPMLSVGYDSSRANGPLGMGWSLGGISRISRCMKNGYDEPNEVGPVTWGPSDALCLDGERMVLVAGTKGDDGAQYRTRHDRFARITVRGTDSLGPKTFEVHLKDHRILYFGLSASDRLEGSATSARGQDSLTEPTLLQSLARHSWMLSRVEDRSGNFVRYQYQNGTEDSGLEPLIQAIEYTGSRRDPQTRRTVTFEYASRPDVAETYFAGMRLRRTLLLKSISMFAPQPVKQQLVRKYWFDYDVAPVTQRSRLRSVLECDSDPTELPANVTPLCRDAHFRYQDADLGFDDIDTGVDIASTTIVDGKWVIPRIAIGDFNGDGRDDIIYTSEDGARRVRLGNGVGFGPASRGLVGETMSFYDQESLLDYDADSLTDVLKLDYPESSIYRSSSDDSGATTQEKLLAIPGGAYRVRVTDLGATTEVFRQLASVAAVDLDGDRRPDLLVHEDRWPWFDEPDFDDPVGNWSVIWNTGANVIDKRPLPILLRPDLRFVDIDGDGRAEILTRVGDHSLLMALSVAAPSNFGAFQTALPGQANYVFLDINGDGLSDVLVDPPTPPSWGLLPDNVSQRLWISLGNGFVPRGINLSFVDPTGKVTDVMGPRAIKRVIDLNLNGRQQLLIRPVAGRSESEKLFVVGFSDDGSATAQELPISARLADFAPDLSSIEVLDANGDGLDDILVSDEGRLHLHIRRGKKPDLLVEASGTLGTHLQFSYKPVAPTRQRWDCQYPVGCVSSKLWVVDELRIDSGLGDGSYRTYTHTFEDGRSDLLGAGFLGFRTHTIEDVASSRVVTLTFDLSPGQDLQYPFVGEPVSIQEVTTLGSGVQRIRTIEMQAIGIRTTDTSGLTAAAPFHISAKTISVVEKDVRASSSSIVSRQNSSYVLDDFGNVTEVVEEWPDESVKRVRKVVYQNRPDDWLVDLAVLVTESSTDSSGKTQTRRRGYEYDDAGLLRRQLIEPGVLTSSGFQTLGPQADGIRTLVTTIERTPEGLPELVSEVDSATGESRGIGTVYDTAEYMFPTITVNPLNHSRTTAFHPALGQVATVTDENGVTTTYQYDGFGRMRFIHSPDGSNRQFTYQAPTAGPFTLEVTESIAGRGSTAYTLDSLGREVLRTADTREDGRLVSVETKYDGLGRVWKRSRPYFSTVGAQAHTTAEYDNLDRLLLLRLADNSQVRHSYFGRVIRTWNTSGNESYVISDTAGRIVRSARLEFPSSTAIPTPPESAIEIVHGPFDLASTVIGSKYRYEVHFDRRGRPIASLDSNAGALSTVYNAFDEIVESSRGGEWKAGLVIGGEKTKYFYDLAGRLRLIESEDGVSSFVWDVAPYGVGRLASAKSPDNIVTQYKYDGLSRLREKTLELDGRKYPVVQHYDSFGRPAAITYPQAGQATLTVQTVYSSRGQPIAVQRVGGGPVYWSLEESDASEDFYTARLGNGVRTQVSGGIDGVLSNIDSIGPAGRVQELRYIFESPGRLREREDRVFKSVERFEYDGFDRVYRWTRHGRTADRTVKWDYDHVGNFRHKTIEVGPGTSLSYEYDGAVAGPHAVVATDLGIYHYDRLGRQIEGPSRKISYTSFDLPKLVTGATSQTSIRYDALHQRASERASDGSSRVSVGRLFEMRTSPQGREHLSHIYANSTLIAIVSVSKPPGSSPPTEKTIYVHSDHLGSVHALTDSNGDVLARMSYEPFGARVHPDDAYTPISNFALGVRTGFTGQRHESQDGLLDYRGRIYDATIGRFLTPDPFVFNPYSPLGYDRYTYVRNNPVNAIDPTGFQPERPTPPPPNATQAELDAFQRASEAYYRSTTRGSGGDTGSRPIANAGGDTGALGSFATVDFVNNRIPGFNAPVRPLSANERTWLHLRFKFDIAKDWVKEYAQAWLRYRPGAYVMIGIENEASETHFGVKGEGALLAGYDPDVGIHVSALVGLGGGQGHAAGVVAEVATIWSSSGRKSSETLLIVEAGNKKGGVGVWGAIDEPEIGAYVFGPFKNQKFGFWGAGLSLSTPEETILRRVGPGVSVSPYKAIGY